MKMPSSVSREDRAARVLRPHPDLERLVELMDAAANVAPDLDPKGRTAKRLVAIVRTIERDAGFRSVDGELAPVLAERDWRFLGALQTLDVSGA